MADNPYRDLPPVDALVDGLSSSLPHGLLVEIARDSLDRARDSIESGDSPDVTLEAQHMADRLARSAGTSLINATGVLLHTNLGRAIWSDAAVERATIAATRYTNLEIDLTTGERSRRGAYVTDLLTKLTGAEDAMVVNNNASALLLALAATASGRAAVVARGELIEIGGSYRLPEVMEVSGARMVEVGTTNRSRRGDYQTALQLHDVGAILKVHPSNYRIEGFTSETTIGDLASLQADVPLIHDIGSGLLDADAPWVPDWLRGEPGAAQSISDGASLVTFSGDKLLGGPQAGLIIGESDLMSRLRSHPLARALRVDGVVYSALAATLEEYVDGKPDGIPFWRQAMAPLAVIEERSHAVAERTGATLSPGSSTVGGGSAPGTSIPTQLTRLTGRDDLFHRLLDQTRPVLARREDGDLVIDLRTVEPDQDETLIDSIRKCL